MSPRHYQFYPDNISTFHFHPGNEGWLVGGSGPSRRQRQEQEMTDMKMSCSFFPPEWMGENVMSYLVSGSAGIRGILFKRDLYADVCRCRSLKSRNTRSHKFTFL